MSITFELGNSDGPRGHALLYYRAGAGFAATYLVVLPFQVDFAKYVPPVLASQVRMSGLEQFSAYALPPVPEAIELYETLEGLARRRNDDLVFGGEIPQHDFLEAAQRVNDDVQEYASLYQRATTSPNTKSGPALQEAASDMSVSEVMFSLMTEKEKLQELAKLVGKLRFAVQGNDIGLAAETEVEMQAIARHLPENYQGAKLIAASKLPGQRGDRLTQLYLERCYKLADGDFGGLAGVEHSILQLETP